VIGHGGDVELDAFLGVALALAVERLMHPVLLEQDHGEQAGAAPAPGDDVERCRRLGDLLAVAAGELLAHGLLDEPVPRHDVEGLGDDLAHFGETAAAATWAARWRRHHDPLPWQMRRQWPPCRALPGMLANHGSGSSGTAELRGCLIFGRGLLEFGQL
jgi:hypothetical protein